MYNFENENRLYSTFNRNTFRINAFGLSDSVFKQNYRLLIDAAKHLIDN